MIKVMEKCNGCHACFNKCPKKCIKMTENEEGFLYPKVDKHNCIKCGVCLKVCPILRDQNVISKEKPLALACINKNEHVRKNSSSGGVFYLLAEEIINQNGVVFGASFNENFDVIHDNVERKEDIYKLQGSKYVQSKIGNSYILVKEFLNDNRKVLFSGTPCQIGGLKSFLGKEYENLILVDIVCHGVPSPKVWNKYIQAISKGRKIVGVNFRDKSSGWKKYNVNIEWENKNKYRKYFYDNPYMKGFLKDIYLRKSCYNCQFKSLKRISDITLADFWGIQNIYPDLDDDNGTSLVFIQNKKGQVIFNKVENKLIYRECDIDKAIVYNSSAIKSVQHNVNRDEFFQKLEKGDIETLISSATKEKLIIRLKTIVRKILSRIKKLCNY